MEPCHESSVLDCAIYNSSESGFFTRPRGHGVSMDLNFSGTALCYSEHHWGHNSTQS
jgi:hypothetical protein